ncbi:MAG: MBL fold metallo-hydrolase [Clostridiales bacterium]|nr:MBL fold metallo-hydrolase [Clostridiales bacterium]
MREAIDFSCKHDILIRHKDGTLTPMDEPYYEVTQIAPGTWQIMSSGDYHYLLEGDEEGISIDTGYGAGNLREFLESIIGKPVRTCINTHYHFDHSTNNCYFDKVYMAEEDVDKAAVAYPSFDGIVFPRDYAVQVVKENDIIPLKGRELEIFKIGDHTPGGIAILDRRERLLFAGDEVMPGGKMISGTVEKLRNDMGKLMEHRTEFDQICGGPMILGAEEIDIFYEAAGKILAGECSPVTEEEQPRRRPDFKKDEENGGTKIYDCQHPHPEDVPGGRPGDKPKGPGNQGVKQTFLYKERRFMYDPARLWEKQPEI